MELPDFLLQLFIVVIAVSLINIAFFTWVLCRLVDIETMIRQGVYALHRDCKRIDANTEECPECHGTGKEDCE